MHEIAAAEVKTVGEKIVVRARQPAHSHLTLDQLKIDQSFVRDVMTDTNDAAIAKTVVALAQSRGLAVIAECVESEAQRDFLFHHGCHAYQGYLFSRALPLLEFEQFLESSTPNNRTH